MPDCMYRVTFTAKPIVVHAPTPERAIEIAIEYLRQPDSKRIAVEHANTRSSDKGQQEITTL
jgi:hypothetical protein